MTEDKVAEYQLAVLDINVEEWYDLIKEETFETEFIPFTVDDAKAFIEAYEQTQHVDKVKESPKISDEVWQKLKPLEQVRFSATSSSKTKKKYLRNIITIIFIFSEFFINVTHFINTETSRLYW